MVTSPGIEKSTILLLSVPAKTVFTKSNHDDKILSGKPKQRDTIQNVWPVHFENINAMKQNLKIEELFWMKRLKN